MKIEVTNRKSLEVLNKEFIENLVEALNNDEKVIGQVNFKSHRNPKGAFYKYSLFTKLAWWEGRILAEFSAKPETYHALRGNLLNVVHSYDPTTTEILKKLGKKYLKKVSEEHPILRGVSTFYIRENYLD